MKSCLLFIVLFTAITLHGIAQPCKQITIDDTTQRGVLGRYINQSIKGNYFVHDKGVVVVTKFTNELGRPVWLISTAIDDKYKDNPPLEWATFGQDVVLFYNARSRFEVIKTKATPELLSCLDQVIGDRLYIRPPVRDRWVNVTGPDGKPHKRSARRIFGGNTSNEQIITFEADGTIKVLQSI